MRSERPASRPVPTLLAAALLAASSACVGSVSGGDPDSMDPAPGAAGPTPRAPGSSGSAGGSPPTASGGSLPGGPPPTAPPVVPPAVPPTVLPPATAADGAGPLPMRRLTRREYNNTIAALLGDTSNPGDALPADTFNETGFLSPRDVSTLEARIYHDASAALAARAVQNLTKLLPCDPTKVAEAACARQFVERFGRRAFRRPLVEAEIAELVGLYDTTRALGLDFPTGIQLALQAILQSPKLIYRWEIVPGTKLVVEGRVARLTPHQVASRLSYFLWAAPPDDELLDAADGNRLATPAELQAQVQRMLRDPRSGAALAEFHRQWLHLQGAGGIDSLEKSPSKFPAYNDAVRVAMKESFDATVAAVFLDDAADHSWKGLLAAPVAYLNEKTAPLVGITDVKGSKPLRRELDATQRAGILTHPAFLAVHATASGTHPTKRGTVVWRNLLCGATGQIPADVPDIKETPNTTTRQRFEEHDKAPCAACHMFLDPPGFAFEMYDALGQHRTKEGTAPIDASGSFTLPGGDKLTFKNAVDLMSQLAASDEVHRCVTRQWYRYALGRADTDADAASIDAGHARAKGAGGDLREIISTLVTTKTFLYRQLEQGETP